MQPEAHAHAHNRSMAFEPANPEHQTPALPTIDPIKLAEQPVPERRWIVPYWIPDRAVTMLAGDGGVGKSLLAMQLLTSVAIGSPWLGLPVTECRALGVFCEDDPDELHRRQDAINREYGIGFGDLENLSWVSRVGDNAVMMAFDSGDHGTPTELYQQIYDAARNFGAQLIVLDALHDVFAGNENARPQARQFINLLHGLARDCDGAVVLCAHPSLTGMSSGSGMSGSTAWNNAVRSRLYLSRPKADDGAEIDEHERTLRRVKANYASGDSFRCRWKDGVFTAIEIPGGIFGTIDRHRAEHVFLDILTAMESVGRTVSDNRHSGTYAPRIFAKRPDREDFQKADFERAMESLFAQKKIKIETYGDRPSRQFKKIVATGAEDDE